MVTTKEIIEVSVIAVVQTGVLVWYFLRNRKQANIDNSKRAALAQQYPFEGMRNIALNTVPGAIVANVPDNEVYVYAVVMDWDMGNDIISLVTRITGDADLFVQSGGGIIGAGKYPGISEAAQKFTAMAQQYLDKAVSTIASPLPQKNCVQFCLLTNKGKFVATELMQNIENKSTQWTGLFQEASNVINLMRQSLQ